MDNNSKVNQLILKSAYITIIILIIIIIALIMLKYNVEGEKNMPFKLSSILVISTAEGNQVAENKEFLWDAEVYQNNDIYLNIEKNKNYKETEIIKSIAIENIKIKEEPIIGNIKFYRSNGQGKNDFDYSEQYEIKNSIKYLGATSTDLNNLRISNQGGTLIIRMSNKTGKRYISNEKELEHSGKLLNQAGITYESIKSTILFDLVISLESGISFRTTIELQVPVGDISKTGSSIKEITDMKNIIFKREQA